MKDEAEPSRAGEAATWGGTPKPRIDVLSFKSMRRNTLVGFVTVRFGNRLKLNDCPVQVHPGGRGWVALPARPTLDEEGRHKRDVNGKGSYTPVAEWVDRSASDHFSEIVIALVRERYPSVLDVEAHT